MRQPTFERQLQAGHFLHWQGQTYRLLPRNGADPLSLSLEHVVTAEQHTIRMEELLLNSGNEAGPIFAPTLAVLQQELEGRRQAPATQVIHPAGLPAALLRQADRIVAVVETVERLIAAEAGRARLHQGGKFKRTPAIKRACAQLAEPIKSATYYKYHQLYRQAKGDRDQIAAGLRRSSFHQNRMDRARLHFIDTHILRFYARRELLRLRPQEVYEIARATLKRTTGLWLNPESCVGPTPENLVEELLNPRLPLATILDNPQKARLLRPIELPSRSWFYAYLRWFEHQPDQGKTIITARYGQATWERETMVFDTFVNRASMPLQYVFADHWLVDVLTVDEATRSRLDRLWLTLLIDVYSRSILGLALLYEAPCIDSIQSALRHAVWPKTSPPELGLKAEWVCYGIPLQLFLDNAWPHHAHSLENLARVIGQNGRYNSIDLIFRPPYTGRYGALIERLFGNFSGRMKAVLPGALRSTAPEGRRQASQEACLLYQDLYGIVYEMIVAYQHTPHRELAGLTPHEKWLEGLQFGLPLVPPLTPTIERLFWRRSPETRIITQQGVCVFGLHYWSPDLAGVERIGPDGRPVRYNFSYEPSDISRLALFRDGQWLADLRAKELRLADGSTLPLSLSEHKIAHILAQRDGQSGRDWLAYLYHIDELTRRRLAERQQTRRSQAGQTAAPKPKIDLQVLAAAIELTGSTGNHPNYTELLADFVGHSNEPEVNL